jgi:hypothetical protein
LVSNALEESNFLTNIKHWRRIARQLEINHFGLNRNRFSVNLGGVDQEIRSPAIPMANNRETVSRVRHLDHLTVERAFGQELLCLLFNFGSTIDLIYSVKRNLKFLKSIGIEIQIIQMTYVDLSLNEIFVPRL